MTQKLNPYSPAAEESVPLAEQIRQLATRAAVLGFLGVLGLAFLAPLAVYFGYVCLRRIRQSGVGLEHRGAAHVGVILGCLGSALFARWFA